MSSSGSGVLDDIVSVTTIVDVEITGSNSKNLAKESSSTPKESSRGSESSEKRPLLLTVARMRISSLALNLLTTNETHST